MFECLNFLLKLTIIIIYVDLHINNDCPVRNRQTGAFSFALRPLQGNPEIDSYFCCPQKYDCRYSPGPSRYKRHRDKR